MTLTCVITGASGFLGQTLLERAATSFPSARVVSIYSPRCGGIDLTHPRAPERLEATMNIANAEDAVLIHAAATVKWDSPEGFLANAAMALHVATWARSANIGFCVLVSGVNVYAPCPLVDVETPCEPKTMYGLGKWAAEQAWRLLLPPERSAIVRLAGIWGWQRGPTLFWNQLLWAAARGSPPQPRPVVHRSRSRRNYISAREAGDCLLRVGSNRMSGLFLGAGRDVVDTGFFVKALHDLPHSRLSIDWQDDGGMDESIYRPSGELLPHLKSFPDELSTIWANRPHEV